jgi:glyoxylase-like metal-dependent hydrolase (beta-lactamase superfamily II)
MAVPLDMSSTAPRVVKAGNRGLFTLDGTRSYLIGEGQAAVIDPGPDVEDHVRALAVALGGASEVNILLTHHHRDHAGGAHGLARALRGTILGPPSAGYGVLQEGDLIPTDKGEIVALSTPGHTRDHLSFFWPRRGALFVGDLLLGRGSTTWLGEYPGCVADYLASLEKVARLTPTLIFPAHGPAIRDVQRALRRFRSHRLKRLAQLRSARGALPGASPEELAVRVYGVEMEPRLLKAARSSIEVMLHHLEREHEEKGG